VTRLTRQYLRLVKSMNEHAGNDLSRLREAFLICYTCDQPIQLGEKVVRKNSGPRGSKYRHYRCAKRIRLI